MEKQVIDGFLLLDKPVGITSNRALQTVKRLFNAKKAGFLGTLDPFASGMLPICFGRATKAVERLHALPKTYSATLKLGARTTTGDPEGEICETKPFGKLTEALIENAMQAFVGEIMQTPPLYSAIKKGGVPLYKLARQGLDVERSARQVMIYDLKFTALEGEELHFEVCCGKGMYVRVLAEDLAAKLGTCGYLTSLRRLSCGGFEEQQMVTLETLNALALQGSQSPESALVQGAG